MIQPVFVHADILGNTHSVGRLWAHFRRGVQSASFEYDKSWLTKPGRFSLEPALKLGAGSFHTRSGKSLFGAIGDSAPDRWGRILIRRKARHLGREKLTAQISLTEIDYLLQVNDHTRQGALRFSLEENGPFLTRYDNENCGIPPAILLPKLLAAADNVTADRDSSEDIALLLAPGSSLGGTRPKASVIDKTGILFIAKFPSNFDESDTVKWEAVALALAEKAGIQTPEWKLESVAGRSILLLKRFDRKGSIRIPFLSAMSMIDSIDNEIRSYLELADALRMYGASPLQDMSQLWRRIVFTILISNVDDHMRNHGFLYQGTEGWILSPAYDMNPTPTDIRPRILSSAITFNDNEASLETAFEVADYFGISPESARLIAYETGISVKNWSIQAELLGISKKEIDRMASAFDHRDLSLALKGLSLH